MAPGHGLLLHFLQQQPDHGPPHLLQRLPHCGQARLSALGQWKVVETDDGDVLGHPPPGRAQCLQRTSRRGVRSGEDGVDLPVPLEEFRMARRPLSSEKSPSATQDGDVCRPAGASAS